MPVYLRMCLAWITIEFGLEKIAQKPRLIAPSSPRQVYDCCNALEEKIDEVTEQMFTEAGESSEGMKVMHSSRGMWVSMVTQDAIVQGLFEVRCSTREMPTHHASHS